MKIHKIEARDLPDLWFQAVNDIIDVGNRFKIDRGSYTGQIRLEYDYFIGHIIQPWFGSGTKEILPDIPAAIGIPNPCEPEYIYGGTDKNGITYNRSYIEYLMTATKELGESYTYGERLIQAELDWWQTRHQSDFKNIIIQDKKLKEKGIIYQIEGNFYINQIELIIYTYKKYGYRNNQMVLQIARPTDCFLLDPPCLRHIDTRIQSNPIKERINLNKLAHDYGIEPWNGSASAEGCKDALRERAIGKRYSAELEHELEKNIKACEVPTLHFIVYFRSWDLWGGLPANLAAIQTLKEYMAGEIGVDDGEMIVESKGLHLYGYAENLAKMRCLKGE